MTKTIENQVYNTERVINGRDLPEGTMVLDTRSGDWGTVLNGYPTYVSLRERGTSFVKAVVPIEYLLKLTLNEKLSEN
jgi:hypothetical protein